MKMCDLKKYLDTNRINILEKYKRFLSFKTVSLLSSSSKDLKACALWLRDELRHLGGTVELWEEDRSSPIVFAHFLSKRKDAPTILIYNHYDVQPADPIDEWDHPPFEGTIVNNVMFGRGAQDDKGQCLFVLLALEAMKGNLPCSIKILIEGEEENGSTFLTSIARTKSKELQADYTMIIDVGMRTAEKPAITLGTRGITSLTVHVKGPNQDLHSGLYGGIAYNPLHALVSMLSSLRNDDGSIAVPGFYDELTMPSDEELSHLALNMDEKKWEEEFGQPPQGGEILYAPCVRNWLRPTLEINGIHGGYGGEGSKTVIPKEALAKISCRLVPNQDPVHVAQCVKQFLLEKTPRGICADIVIHEGKGRATRTKISSPAIFALAKAMEEVWGTSVEYILDGASIPISPLLEEVSGGELVMWGVGLPSDRIHAPNERFSLEQLEKGFCTLCLTLEKIP